MTDPSKTVCLSSEIEKANRLIAQEAKSSKYAPSAFDGLTLIQRAIFAAMASIQSHSEDWVPAAAVAGLVCADYDPHTSSDVAFQEILAMCQPWVMRYPLLEATGSVGVEGDPITFPAIADVAIRPTALARSFVDPVPDALKRDSYRRKRIPKFLNPAFPTLAVNGNVSGKTRIPSHNLKEVCDVLLAICDNPATGTEDLVQIMRGPDFPKGGVVASRSVFFGYAKNGKGQLLVRADMQTEALENGRTRLTISTLPPGVTPEMALKELVAKLKGFPEIVDFRNLSGPEVRIIIDLKDGSDAKATCANLYDKTCLQAKWKVLCEVNDNGQRAYMSLMGIFLAYIDRCIDFEKARIEEAVLTAEGEEQARLQELLDDPNAIKRLVRRRIEDIKATWSDERRSSMAEADFEATEEDLIPDAPAAVIFTKLGFVKRTPAAAWREQKRGGKGSAGMQTGEALDETEGSDVITQTLVANTHDNILFLTNVGKAYRRKVHQIPEGDKNDSGGALASILDLAPGEVVLTTVTYRAVKLDSHIILGTTKGLIKKTPLSDYSSLKNAGKTIIDIQEGDSLVSASITHSGDDVMMVSECGQSIRFSESTIRASGGKTRGVTGMKLEGRDRVISMVIPRHGASLLVVGETGLGKRTALDQYGRQSRGGKGVATMKIGERTGKIVAAVAVFDVDSVLFVSTSGQSLRTGVDSIPSVGRNTSGSVLMAVKSDDGEVLKSAAVIPGDRPEGSDAPAGVPAEDKGEDEEQFTPVPGLVAQIVEPTPSIPSVQNAEVAPSDEPLSVTDAEGSPAPEEVIPAPTDVSPEPEVAQEAEAEVEQGPNEDAPSTDATLETVTETPVTE